MEKDIKQIHDGIIEVKQDISYVKEETNSIKDKVHNVEVVLARNTESLETHVRRTDLLEDMIKPLHEERLKALAIKEYRQQSRADLLYKLKLPVMLVAALGAISTVVAWIVGVF